MKFCSTMDYVIWGCCLLAFLMYYNTLDAGFVYDDRRAILSNPDLLSDTPWSRLLEHDFWGTPLNDSGSHGSYRPLCVLTFRLNHWMGGFRPWGYHLGNILLHCLATALLVKVARQVLPRSKLKVGTTVAGLVFATHPVHTEAVAGVVGRADLAACNFYFLSLLTYIAHVRYRDATVYGKVCTRNKSGEAKRYRRLIVALPKNVVCAGCQWTACRSHNGIAKSCDREVALIMKVDSKDGCSDTYRQWFYMALTLLFAAAAMLSKETGITVLGLCFVYDIVYSSYNTKEQTRSLLILVSALSIILAVRLQIKTPQFSQADNPTAKESSFLTRFLTFTYLPVLNFWLLIFPNTLSFDWGMDAVPRITSLRDSRNLVSCLFYVFLIYVLKDAVRLVILTRKPVVRPLYIAKDPCAVCQPATYNHHHHHHHHQDLQQHTTSCRTSNNNNTTHFQSSSCVCSSKNPHNHHRHLRTVRSDHAALFSIAFLVLPFVPASNVMYYVGFVIAERVLYMPSVGLCLLLGLSSAVLWNSYRKYRLVFVCAFVAVLAAFSARTVLRNLDWKSEEALYRSAIPVNPPKAYGNLGSILSSQGRIAEAERAFRMALNYRPNMADVHYNLALLLQEKNRLDEAILSYQRAIHFRPSLALAYVNLGAALVASGRCQEAAAILRRAAKLDGSEVRDRREHEAARVAALLRLGSLYAEQGRLQRALAAYREAADSLPDNYPKQSVFNVLGETLARLEQDEEAERWYIAALHAQPNHVPAHITYGKLLAKNISRASEAEQWFRKAQRLAPDDPGVYHHYGEFLASYRRYHEAAEMYSRAAELRPGDYELAVAAATAARRAADYAQAEKWYRKAVDIKPKDSKGHTNLGAILHLNGKYREAALSYRKALRLQPNDVTTLANLHKLHTVMN